MSPRTASQRPRAIFHPLVDSALRLSRGDRREFLRRTRSAIERFPAIAEADRAALVRGIALQDTFNRIAFRLHNAFPRFALALTRAVPIVGTREAIARTPLDRPIVLGLLHFGPIHLAIATSLRLFANRRVFVFYAGGERGVASERFLADIGTTPVLTGSVGFPAVMAAMRKDPACVVVVCYDHLGGRGRRRVRFLGAEIDVPTGLAHLVASTGAVAITSWWEWRGLRPFLCIGETLELELEGAVEERTREDDLTDRSIAVLDARVRAAPAQWSEWVNCYEADL